MQRASRLTVTESVDPGTVSASQRTRAYRQAGLFLLCAAWIVLGLVGRDPWKTEDAITFAAAWEMLQRSDWLIPYLAQERTLHQAPLVPWLSATSVKLFSPMLDAHDAGRIAIGLLLALLLAFTGAAGRELNGRAMRWMPVLILVGSVGLFDRSHQLSPELGLAVAVAIAIYGVALASRKPAAGGAVLGVGMGLAFLASGWIGPLWTLVPAVLLPAFGAAWRTRNHVITLAVAIAIALPLIVAWPWALYARSADLFTEWWRVSSPAALAPWISANGSPDPSWLAKNLIWVAWPAVPLIVWMLWIRGRGFNGGLNEPGVIVPGLYSIVMLAMLALAPEPRLMQMLPVLAPLALVASLEIDSWKREHSAALDWFGILTFGLTAIVLWAFWIDAYVNGMSTWVAVFLRDTETGYGTSFHLREFLAAVFLTVLWIVLVRPARRSNRRAILNWAAGMTLIWGLIATIWLPYLDARRTYRAVAESIGVYRPENACIARRNVGEAQRAAFYYFAGVVTVPENSPQAADCPTLLVQYGRLSDGTPPLDGYRVQWEGKRRGDETERFVLYRRTA
jgi:4-amino-4-deoxy-L-arabinose transferase-like glycosyltransferase